MGGVVSVEKGDEALRFVGKLELIKNIVVSVLVALACAAGAVALYRWHHDYKRAAFKVMHVKCVPPVTTAGEHGPRTVTVCSDIKLEGFSQTFASQYVAPAVPPQKGDHVDVLYDPHDRARHAVLVENAPIESHKVWIIALLVLVCVASLYSAWFQYYVKGSHLAQRVAGGAAVVDMVM